METPRAGRSTSEERTIAAVDEAVDRPEHGCGSRMVGLPLAVPLALVSIALALIWLGPGSQRLWALKALAVAVGGLLLVMGRFARIAAKASRNASLPESMAPLGPYISIADAVAGRAHDIVALRGASDPADADGELPRAPLSRTHCLYYELTVHRIEEVFANQGDRFLGLKEHWEQIYRQTRSIPFVLRDQSGRILVDPAGALVGAAQGEGRRAAFGPDDLAVRSLEDELRGAGIELALAWHTDERTRTIGYAISEEVLLPGWELTVVGPLQVRGGAPIVSRRGRNDVFSIATVAEDDLVVGMRRLVSRSRVASILWPLLGAALVVLGFWFVLTA